MEDYYAKLRKRESVTLDQDLVVEGVKPITDDFLEPYDFHPHAAEFVDQSNIQDRLEILAKEIMDFSGKLTTTQILSWIIRKDNLLEYTYKRELQSWVQKDFEKSNDSNKAILLQEHRNYKNNKDADTSDFARAINARAEEIVKVCLNNLLKFTTTEAGILNIQHAYSTRSILNYLADIKGINPIFKAVSKVHYRGRYPDKITLERILENYTAAQASPTDEDRQYLEIINKLPFNWHVAFKEGMAAYQEKIEIFLEKYNTLRSAAKMELEKALGLESESANLGSQQSEIDMQTDELLQKLKRELEIIITLRDESKTKLERNFFYLKQPTFSPKLDAKDAQATKTDLKNSEIKIEETEKLDEEDDNEIKNRAIPYNFYESDYRKYHLQAVLIQKQIDEIERKSKRAMQRFVDFLKVYDLYNGLVPRLVGYGRPYYVVGLQIIADEIKNKATPTQIISNFGATPSWATPLNASNIISIFEATTTYSKTEFYKFCGHGSSDKLFNGEEKGFPDKEIEDIWERIIRKLNILIDIPVAVGLADPAKAILFIEEVPETKPLNVKPQELKPKKRVDISNQEDRNNTTFNENLGSVVAVSNTTKALCNDTLVFNPDTCQYVPYIPEDLQIQLIEPNSNLAIKENDIVVQIYSSLTIPIPEGGNLEFVGCKVHDTDCPGLKIKMFHKQNHVWSLELDQKYSKSVDLELIFREKGSIIDSDEIRNEKGEVVLTINFIDPEINGPNLPKNSIFYQDFPPLVANHPLTNFFLSNEQDSKVLADFKKSLREIGLEIQNETISQKKALDRLCKYLQGLKIEYKFTNIDYEAISNPLEVLSTKINLASNPGGGGICQDMADIFGYSCIYLGINAYKDRIFTSSQTQDKSFVYLNNAGHVRNVVIVDGEKLIVDPTDFTIKKEDGDRATQRKQKSIQNWQEEQKKETKTDNQQSNNLPVQHPKDKVHAVKTPPTLPQIVDQITYNLDAYGKVLDFAKKYFINPIIYGEKIPEINDHLLYDLHTITLDKEQINQAQSLDQDKVESTSKTDSSKRILNRITSTITPRLEKNAYSAFVGFLFDQYYDSKTQAFSTTPTPGNKVHSIISTISPEYKQKVVPTLKKLLFDEQTYLKKSI